MEHQRRILQQIQAQGSNQNQNPANAANTTTTHPWSQLQQQLYPSANSANSISGAGIAETRITRIEEGDHSGSTNGSRMHLHKLNDLVNTSDTMEIEQWLHQSEAYVARGVRDSCAGNHSHR